MLQLPSSNSDAVFGCGLGPIRPILDPALSSQKLADGPQKAERSLESPKHALESTRILSREERSERVQ